MKNRWFEDVFLRSIFDRIGHETRWLTSKQTAICTQYMDKQTVRLETATGYCNHDNYVYSWNGRDVFLCYSSKNGCGTIRFGLNSEEQEQARIKNEAEKRQQILERARRKLERHPEKYFQRIEEMKAKISDYLEEIKICIEEDDTYGIKNLEKYVEEMQTELSLWESVNIRHI